MILVDTNVWSEATRAAPHPAVQAWAMANAREVWLSAVVLAELRGGAAIMPAGKRRAALTELIDAIASEHEDRLLPFGEAETRSYGVVLAAARAAGKPIMAADAMIAATAHAHGMAIATRDVADFAGTGVSLINPWES